MPCGVWTLAMRIVLKLADGDYLDMGKPLYQGGVVPVTIKSLAFSG